MSQYAVKSKFDIPKASKTEDINGLKSWVMSVFESFRSQILAELKMIERTAQGSTTAAVSAASSAANPATTGGGGGTTSTDPPAQSVAIAAVADTTIPFLTPVPVAYVVRCWFYDAGGSPSDVWIADADCSGGSFIVRASQIPGPGTLYYQVSRKA